MTPVSNRCLDGYNVLPSGDVVDFRSLIGDVGKDRKEGKSRVLVPRARATLVCGAKRILAASMASELAL